MLCSCRCCCCWWCSCRCCCCWWCSCRGCCTRCLGPDLQALRPVLVRPLQSYELLPTELLLWLLGLPLRTQFLRFSVIMSSTCMPSNLCYLRTKVMLYFSHTSLLLHTLLFFLSLLLFFYLCLSLSFFSSLFLSNFLSLSLQLFFSHSLPTEIIF